MRGRLPKHPDQLKMEGQWRAGRHGIQRPKGKGKPRMPKLLTGEARSFWKKYSGLLDEVATDWDSASLTLLSEMYAEFMDATKQRDTMIDVAEALTKVLNDMLLVVPNDEVYEKIAESLDVFAGFVKKNCRFRHERIISTYRCFLAMAKEFGLTPAARRALPEATQSIKDDPFESFLKNRTAM